MATAKISQTFPDGTEVEVVMDSDLDTLAEVAAATLGLWRDAVVEE